MDSILIIDDEPQIRKLLSRMMELEGYRSIPGSRLPVYIETT